MSPWTASGSLCNLSQLNVISFLQETLINIILCEHKVSTGVPSVICFLVLCKLPRVNHKLPSKCTHPWSSRYLRRAPWYPSRKPGLLSHIRAGGRGFGPPFLQDNRLQELKSGTFTMGREVESALWTSFMTPTLALQASSLSFCLENQWHIRAEVPNYGWCFLIHIFN